MNIFPSSICFKVMPTPAVHLLGSSVLSSVLSDTAGDHVGPKTDSPSIEKWEGIQKGLGSKNLDFGFVPSVLAP